MALAFDSLVLLFLAVTIYVCYKLNKRIAALQDGRSELAEIIHEFDETTRRATESIAELHSATQRISENIQHRIDKANFLADDLQMLVERGNKMMAKLAPHVGDASGNSNRRPAAPAAVSSAPGERTRSRAEQELAQLLKAKESGDI